MPAGAGRTVLPGGGADTTLKKRIFPALAALLLLLSLCACGSESTAAFRTVEVIGTRYYSVICRKDDKIAAQIDEAMRGLAASGTLSTLSTRYLGGDRITLRGDSAATADSAEEQTDSAGSTRQTLIVGVEENFVPMAYEENGVLRGLSVEIAAALGEALGWEVVYQPITSAEVDTQLASGNIDCALGFDPLCVNAERYSVGVTYMESDIVLAVRPESEINRIRDLKERRIGTLDDPALTAAIQGSEKLVKYAAGATAYASLARCVEALDDAWCSAIVVDSLMLTYY